MTSVIATAAEPDYFDLAARMIESNIGRGQGLSLGDESTAFIGLIRLPSPMELQYVAENVIARAYSSKHSKLRYNIPHKSLNQGS